MYHLCFILSKFGFHRKPEHAITLPRFKAGYGKTLHSQPNLDNRENKLVRFILVISLIQVWIVQTAAELLGSYPNVDHTENGLLIFPLVFYRIQVWIL